MHKCQGTIIIRSHEICVYIHPATGREVRIQIYESQKAFVFDKEVHFFVQGDVEML